MANPLHTNTNYQTIYNAFQKHYNEQIDKISLPFNFNILDAQCGTIKENSHTNILMKLLGYKNQYGYVFFEDFVKSAGFDEIKDRIDPSKLIFKTEFFSQAEKRGRIDGIIYQKEDFAIIIENKVNGAPNQDEQLKRYIDSVIKKENGKGLVSANNVYVIFLTKDGIESPDEESIKYMRGEGIGILNPSELGEESELISGQRYFACSYRYDILPWLENNVQPFIFQKESILHTGLIQYIDFLKGMLGERAEDNDIRKRCRNKFDELVENILQGKDLEGQNTELYNLYKFLQNLYKDIKGGSDANKKKKTDCINLLQSLVYEKAEEPMVEFMKVTKDYFTSGSDPLIMEKDYRMSAVLSFYYIFIRDKNWPKGVKIGWYPARLLNDSPTASLFYEDPNNVGTDEKKEDEHKFKYNIKGKAWRKEYNSSDLPRINDEQFDGKKLKELYDKSGIRQIIESINKSINKTAQ